MTAIASRAHIVEFESQVRAFSNRDLVVRVKMALIAVEAVAKLGQHSIRGRGAEAGLSKHFDNLGLTGAVHTLPAIALEAENAQPKVISIVSALGGRAASYVVFTLSLAAVSLARSAGC